MNFHIGIDLGGTKILIEALTATGETLYKKALPTPRNDYVATIKTITNLVAELEHHLSPGAPIGIGMPGSLLKTTKCVQNANSTWLNGKDFKADLTTALNREIRLANDANCFALSEAIDGNGSDARSIFGVIIGTGVGGGLVVDRKIIDGPRSIGGEWGHCSLPFSTEAEIRRADKCWCGQFGCIETWLSGPTLTKQYNTRTTKQPVEQVEKIVERAKQQDQLAQEILKTHAERTARGLSMVVNIFDPEVIILGGGLSELTHLYSDLPDLMQPYIFSDENTKTDIRAPKHGPTSGVRGAARLWAFT